MSAHTQGPWVWSPKLSASENHHGYYIRAATVSNWALATVQPGDEYGKLGEANARLIAAAPELLIALQKLIPGAESMGWDTSSAREVIAKATGAAL